VSDPRRPRIDLPAFSENAAGVYVPASVGAGIIQDLESAFAGVPTDLLPSAQPLIVRQRPSTMEQMWVYPDDEALGWRADRAGLEALVALLPFEPSFLAVSRFQAVLHHVRTDPTAQLGLARELIGDERLLARLQRWVRGAPNRVIFSEQHMHVLQRLLLERAKPVDPDVPATREERSLLLRALFDVRVIIDELARALEEGTPTAHEMVAYLVQNGAFYAREADRHLLARAYSIYITQRRAVEDPRLPLDDWARADSGLTLEEQFTAGFIAYAASKALDAESPAYERSLIDPKAAYRLSALKEKVGAIVRLLATSREEYADEFRAGDQTADDLAWAIAPFLNHPFLVRPDGNLVLTSPHALSHWLTSGLYYRSLASAKSRSTPGNDLSYLFTSYAGSLHERHAMAVAKAAHPGERHLPGSGRIFGEQEYGPAARRRMTPDIVIDLGLDLVAFEVRSGYLTNQTRVAGGLQAVEADLDRLVFKKMNQIGDRIRDLLDGTAVLDGVDATVIQRAWPVLVSADITQSELLLDWIDERLPDTLRAARVRPLTLLDIEDLELLMALVEDGFSLVEILRAKNGGPFRQLEFRRFVREAPGYSEDHYSSYSAAEYDRLGEAMRSVFQGVQAESPPGANE
jgi:hypothetical protein